MKRLHFFGFVMMVALAFTACKDANFKTTPSGLKYKIISGSSKDSTAEGDILKVNIIQKISGHKDTVLTNTYGKLPAFIKVQTPPAGQPQYGPEEVFHQLRKGDSLVAVIFVDSIIKKGLAQEGQLPPFMKKGDRITFTFKVMEVFKNDSLAQADYQKEMERDAPRQKKEQEEMMEKMRQEQEAAQKKEFDSLQKAGAIASQEQEVADWLKAKNITAEKTPSGVFVKVNNPGTGPAVENNKFVTVSVVGKKLEGDSTFQPKTSFPVQIGKGGFIKGLEEGMKKFREGGKGLVYIPGYLAYGKNNMGTPFRPYEPMYFEVEIIKVSDTEPAPQAPVH